MSDQLRAQSALSHGKGPTLPTEQEAIHIVEGALIGAFVHLHASKSSHFWVRVRVKSK